MNIKVYKWICNCVSEYFCFINREFECKELGLKLGIYKNTDKDYYIEFRHNDKISILTGGHKLSKGQMIDLLEDSFIKDFKNPKYADIDKIYNFISKSVYSLDGTYRQAFQDKDLDIKIQVYTHALSSESFDYWIKANGKSEKIYINTNCKLAEDLIDKIYSSYINDFLEHDCLRNDPTTYSNHMKNKNHTLQLQLEDKDRQIYELKDKVSYLQSMIDGLKINNTSLINYSNKNVKDNVELVEQIKTLEKDVETWKKASIENHGAYQSAMKNSEDWKNKYIQEKMDHTTTGARIVYAKHILSGNRDEKVIEHIGETHITNFE
jgi:hypothetical protein